MCYLASISPGQIAAFRDRPELASDFARSSVSDLLEARVHARVTHAAPTMREEHDQSSLAVMEQHPSPLRPRPGQRTTHPDLAALGPFEPLLELGKSWHILHYLMTGHNDAAPAPGNVLLTGAPLGQDVGYGPPRLHDPAQTREFGEFLAPLEAGRVVARMQFPRLVHDRLYPLSGVPDAAEADGWREEIAGSFQRLKSYADRAAQRSNGIMTWLI